MRVKLLTRSCAVLIAIVLVSDAAARTSTGIPLHGVFAPGKTLAGVGLGFTEARVLAHWGQRHTVCSSGPYCSVAQPVWLFQYPVGEPLGVAARFRNGKTVSVFTLGAVGVNSLSAGGGGGWKTVQGLHITDPISSIYSLYPAAVISTNCILYSALSMREGNIVSTFYTSSGTVYGFALSLAGEPICN